LNPPTIFLYPNPNTGSHQCKLVFIVFDGSVNIIAGNGTVMEFFRKIAKALGLSPAHTCKAFI